MLGEDTTDSKFQTIKDIILSLNSHSESHQKLLAQLPALVTDIRILKEELILLFDQEGAWNEELIEFLSGEQMTAQVAKIMRQDLIGYNLEGLIDSLRQRHITQVLIEKWIFSDPMLETISAYPGRYVFKNIIDTLQTYPETKGIMVKLFSDESMRSKLLNFTKDNRCLGTIICVFSRYDETRPLINKYFLQEPMLSQLPKDIAEHGQIHAIKDIILSLNPHSETQSLIAAKFLNPALLAQLPAFVIDRRILTELMPLFDHEGAWNEALIEFLSSEQMTARVVEIMQHSSEFSRDLKILIDSLCKRHITQVLIEKWIFSGPMLEIMSAFFVNATDDYYHLSLSYIIKLLPKAKDPKVLVENCLANESLRINMLNIISSLDELMTIIDLLNQREETQSLIVNWFFTDSMLKKFPDMIEVLYLKKERETLIPLLAQQTSFPAWIHNWLAEQLYCSHAYKLIVMLCQQNKIDLITQCLFGQEMPSIFSKICTTSHELENIRTKLNEFSHPAEKVFSRFVEMTEYLLVRREQNTDRDYKKRVNDFWRILHQPSSSSMEHQTTIHTYLTTRLFPRKTSHFFHTPSNRYLDQREILLQDETPQEFEIGFQLYLQHLNFLHQKGSRFPGFPQLQQELRGKTVPYKEIPELPLQESKEPIELVDFIAQTKSAITN